MAQNERPIVFQLSLSRCIYFMFVFYFFFFLSEPVTHIEGLSEKRSELFIKAGSTINLTCVVEDATENAPKHILWRHNSRVSVTRFFFLSRKAKNI